MYAACLTVLGMILFQTIPVFLLGALSPTEAMLGIGIPALRIIGLHFPVAALCIVASSACQALDKSIFSFFSSVLRQVLAMIPAAYLLSLTGNVNMVWWCFPIAEVVSAAANVLFL